MRRFYVLVAINGKIIRYDTAFFRNSGTEDEVLVEKIASRVREDGGEIIEARPWVEGDDDAIAALCHS